MNKKDSDRRFAFMDERKVYEFDKNFDNLQDEAQRITKFYPYRERKSDSILNSPLRAFRKYAKF